MAGIRPRFFVVLARLLRGAPAPPVRSGPGLFPSPQNPHIPGEEPEPESEWDQVVAMRYMFLCGAGFPAEEARLISLCREADWHQAVDMLEKGCDPALITKILT